MEVQLWLIVSSFSPHAACFISFDRTVIPWGKLCLEVFV